MRGTTTGRPTNQFLTGAGPVQNELFFPSRAKRRAMDVTVSERADTAIVPVDGRIDAESERMDGTLAGSKQEEDGSP